jgi:hypothetical protein
MATEEILVAYKCDIEQFKASVKAVETSYGALESKGKTSAKGVEDGFKKAGKEILSAAEGAKLLAGNLDNAGKGAKEIEKTTNAFKALRNEIRDLKAAALAAGETTPIGKEFIKKAGEAQDKLNDLNQSVKNLASDTKLFDAFLQGGRTIAAGFAIAQGATALFGEENQDLQKKLLKVQAGLALLSGLQEIQNALQAESALRITVTNAATAAQATVTGVLTGQLTLATVATNALNAAKNALLGPVGLLLAGIAGIVAIYQHYTSGTKAAAEAQEKLNYQVKISNILFDTYDKALDKIKDKSKDDTEFNLKQAELRGASEKQLLDIKLNGFKQQENLRKKQLIAQGVFGKEEIAKDTEILKIRREAEIATLEFNKKSKDEKIKKDEEASKAAIAAAEKEKAAILKIQKELEELDVSEETKRKGLEIDKKISAERNEIEDDFQDKVIANYSEQTKAGLKRWDDEEERAKQFREYIRDQSFGLASDLVGAFNDQQQAETDAKLNALQEQEEAELNSLVKKKERDLSNKSLTEAQRKAIEDKYEKQKEQAQAKFRAREAELKRKQFESDKEAKIIQATIELALAVIKAFGQGGPALAAITAAFGATQIALIASQPIPKFAKGTPYLQRGNNPQGVDTIPILANEGEGIIPTDKNKKYNAYTRAMINGTLEDYITQNNVMPALRAYVEKSKDAEQVNMARAMAVSIAMNSKGMDEYSMQRAMKKALKGATVNIGNVGDFNSDRSSENRFKERYRA